MPTASQLRRLKRAEKFKKIGAAISALKPKKYYDDRDYHTGKDSEFALKRYDAHQRDEVVDSFGIAYCPWPKARCEVPLGPKFNTPQWDRTVKKT